MNSNNQRVVVGYIAKDPYETCLLDERPFWMKSSKPLNGNRLKGREY